METDPYQGKRQEGPTAAERVEPEMPEALKIAEIETIYQQSYPLPAVPDESDAVLIQARRLAGDNNQSVQAIYNEFRRCFDAITVLIADPMKSHLASVLVGYARERLDHILDSQQKET